MSSSCGSDENTGLTPDTPLRTIAKAQKRGKTIFLKAGDVFHEYVGLSKQELRRYGKGKIRIKWISLSGKDNGKRLERIYGS